MKKIILTISLIVLSLNAVFAEDVLTPYNLDTMYDKYYESPISAYEPEQKDVIGNSDTADVDPVFKRIRIRITNFFRKKDYAYQEAMLKKQAEMFEDEIDFEEDIIHADKIMSNPTVQETNTAEDSNKTIALTGSVKEQKVENDVMLDSDDIVYDEVNDEIQAIGSPVLVFPAQKVKLTADKMTYNNSSNVLKAYGNVVLEKDGTFVYGDYVQINMNEENAFMDNVKLKQTNFVVRSRKVSAQDDKTVFDEGYMKSDGSYILNLQTQMIKGQDFTKMILDEDEKSHLSDRVGEVPFRLTAEKITVEGKKEHDTVTVLNGNLYYGDTKLWRFKKFTAHTDKKHSYFEANYPELGSRSRLGMFLGPGYMFDLPNGSVVKAIPFLNYKGELGVGGALKYRSANNITDFMYGSAEDIFVAKGRQRLDDKLYFQYGINSYVNEDFMGQNMAKYAAELYYQDNSVVKDTLTKDLDLRFRHKAGIGYMHNSSWAKYFGNIPSFDTSTTRFKYMASIEQSLFKRKDEENKKLFDLTLVMQGSAAVYGTGDTQFIGRIGPRIHTQYKRWMQDIAYYLSAYDDHTPLALFDTYRYGHSSLHIREALRINKYLSIGWTGNINLSDDAPNGKTFQENAFIFAIGPDDFKLNLGYDFIRQQTYFAFNVAMDMKGSNIEYKKMEIKNPDRIARTNDKAVKLVPTFEEVHAAKFKKQSQPVLKYAEVIDIEDPNKEQL